MRKILENGEEKPPGPVPVILCMGTQNGSAAFYRRLGENLYKEVVNPVSTKFKNVFKGKVVIV